MSKPQLRARCVAQATFFTTMCTSDSASAQELATKYIEAGGNVPDDHMVVFRNQGQSLKPGQTLAAQHVDSGTTLKTKLVHENDVAAWMGGDGRGGADKVLIVLTGFDVEHVALEAEPTNTVMDLIQVLRTRGDVWGRGLEATFQDRPLTPGTTLEKAGVQVGPVPDEDGTLYISAGEHQAQDGSPADGEKKCCVVM